MVTRREQLGTEDHQLPPGHSKEERGRGRGHGRGGGRGRGRGRAKKNAKDDQDETGETRDKDDDKDDGKDAEIKDKNTEIKPAVEENTSPPEPKKRRTRKHQQPQEIEPKEEKQSKAADKPSCKRPAAKKKKIEDTKPAAQAPQPKKAKTKKTEVKDQTASPSDQVEEETSKAPEKSAPRTWGGRWIPTDEHAHRRFVAIKEVYDKLVAEKVNSPSTLQSPWFTLCVKSFKTKDMKLETTTHEQYVAAAELEVKAFFKLPVVSILAYWCIVWGKWNG